MNPSPAMPQSNAAAAPARALQRLRRYLGIYAALWKNSVTRELSFKGNFLLWIVVELLWFGLQLTFISVIYMHTDSIGTWTKWQVVMLVGASHFIQQIYQAFFLVNCVNLSELVRTGKPPAWRNFSAGHPGVRALSWDDSRLRQPCGCGPLYFLKNRLPLAFEFERPPQLLGLRADAFGLAGWQLKPLLYTRLDRASALTQMSRYFAGLGLRMEPLNEDYHVIRGGKVKLFVRLHATADPATLAVELADHGDIHCVECHHD